MFKFPCFKEPEIEEVKKFRKAHKHLRFSEFEIEYIKKYANLTSREECLLELKNRKDPPSNEECAEIMQMSVSTVSRTITDIIHKIIVIL